jgi:hypothetical protein
VGGRHRGRLVARLGRHWVVVGENVDQGFFVFGSSGAIVVTIVTGLVLRRMLTAPPARDGGVGRAAAANA